MNKTMIAAAMLIALPAFAHAQSVPDTTQSSAKPMDKSHCMAMDHSKMDHSKMDHGKMDHMKMADCPKGMKGTQADPQKPAASPATPSGDHQHSEH